MIGLGGFTLRCSAIAASMLPTSLPGILPAVPEDEFQLPSLRNIDTKRKRKTTKQQLPSLGGRNAREKPNNGKSFSSREDLSSGISKLIGKEGSLSDKKATSQSVHNKGSLAELLEVVKTIEEECLLDREKEKQTEDDLDPFFKCKNAILHVVEETRELVEQRRRILETRGKAHSDYLHLGYF